MSSTSIPLVILAFNRPHYLKPFLASLAAQQGLDRDREDVFLFLDGAVNRYSGQTYGKAAAIERCARLFQRHFPRGQVVRASHNLGVWANFDRAERFVFETLGAEVAYFFEDDLVLSPHYLQVMDSLWAQVRARDDIAHFAAYGNHLAGRQEQLARARDVVTLQHHWGFGLKRSHWQRIDAFLAPCRALLEGVDYRLRPQDALRDWLRSQGLQGSGTSQDYLKSTAATLLGFWRLGTFACWGRYIGATGLHFDRALYRQLGFHRTRLFPQPVTDFAIPEPAGTAFLVQEQLAIYRQQPPGGTPV